MNSKFYDAYMYPQTDLTAAIQIAESSFNREIKPFAHVSLSA